MKITPVSGGQLNRMWRFDTDDGSFAVKELNLDRGWTYRHDDVYRFERAAFHAGIPMPEPIAANETLLVHRWVDGERAPLRPVSADLAREVGGVVARIHALDVDWTHVSIPDPSPTEEDWVALAARAAGQPWADELASIAPVLGAIGRFVDDTGEPAPIVLSHRDVSQKNLLVVDGHAVLVDWEISGRQPLAFELGAIGVALASNDDIDALRPEVFGAMLAGYVDEGGTLPEPGRHWFVDKVGGWSGFLRWNIERCVAGVVPSSGPSLAVAHDAVWLGLREIPRLFASIDRLAELTSLR